MKQDRLEQLKSAYDWIEIPEELESKVKKSIEQAKFDSIAASNPRKNKFTWRGIVGTGVVAAMLAFVVTVNCNSEIAYAMKDIPVIGAVVDVITFSRFQQQDKDMSADVKTPQVTVENGGTGVDEMNQKIQQYTDEIIKQYQEDVKATNGEGYETVTTDYEVVTDNDSLFSLRMNTTVALNTSGVTIKIYHLDKETGKLITLPDFFKENSDYKTVISDEIKRQMREQMAADKDNVTYFLDDADVPDWKWTGITDDANFYINKDGNLVFVFDKYEVAPGYMGVCEFEIPSSLVKDILKPQYQS